MIPLSGLAICILLGDSVQARNETLIDGWVPEPDGRGTWSILWSCLVTIVLCTWSALHLDVPTSTNPFYLFGQKIVWMCVITLMPEWVIAFEVRRFLHVRAMTKHIAKKHGEKGWSLTHMHFACMNGFRIPTLQEGTSPCSDGDLMRLIDKNQIDRPPISEEELSSRSRGDVGFRIIVVLQVLWFVIQSLARATQHLQITAIETMTNAYALCSIVIYVITLKRPQDVAFPVLLELKDTVESLQYLQEERSHKGIPQEAKDDIPQENLKPKNTADIIQLMEEGNKYESIPQKAKDLFSIHQTLHDKGKLPSVWSLTFLLLFALGFGAIHCAAWNAPFPTTKERLAWRIISIVLTILPVFGVALQSMRLFHSPKNPTRADWTIFISSILWFLWFVYVLGRITIIILALSALRALPADVFQTVNWSPYLPHFTQ